MPPFHQILRDIFYGAVKGCSDTVSQATGIEYCRMLARVIYTTVYPSFLFISTACDQLFPRIL